METSRRRRVGSLSRVQAFFVRGYDEEYNRPQARPDGAVASGTYQPRARTEVGFRGAAPDHDGHGDQAQAARHLGAGDRYDLRPRRAQVAARAPQVSDGDQFP